MKVDLLLGTKADAIQLTPPKIIVIVSGFLRPTRLRHSTHMMYAGISTAPAIIKLMYGSPPKLSVPRARP